MKRHLFALMAACAFGATPSLAQEKILRIAMTASDIPTTSGMPNNGFESIDEAAMLKYYAASHECLSTTRRGSTSSTTSIPVPSAGR